MRENGAVLIDGVQVASTMQCCHCNGHFEYRKGSGTQRGFCLNCMKITCGHVNCHECKPYEKQMELLERQERQLIIVGR